MNRGLGKRVYRGRGNEIEKKNCALDGLRSAEIVFRRPFLLFHLDCSVVRRTGGNSALGLNDWDSNAKKFRKCLKYTTLVLLLEMQHEAQTRLLSQLSLSHTDSSRQRNLNKTWLLSWKWLSHEKQMQKVLPSPDNGRSKSGQNGWTYESKKLFSYLRSTGNAFIRPFKGCQRTSRVISTLPPTPTPTLVAKGNG